MDEFLISNAGQLQFVSRPEETSELWWVASVEVKSSASCGTPSPGISLCSSASIIFLIHWQGSSAKSPTPATQDSFLTPQTSRNQFISIQCNTQDFEFSGTKSRALRIGFKPAVPPGKFEWIFQNDDFPRDLTVSPVKLRSTYGYVELTWRPPCEDPSQVGLFLLCFTARGDGYTSEPSYASCIYVKSSPPLPNPAPEILSPLEHACSSSDCISCCGEPNCTLPESSACCRIEEAIHGVRFHFDVRATTQNYVQRVDVNFSYPELPLPLLPTIQKKWGCGDTSFDQCTSNPLISNNVNLRKKPIEFDFHYR